MSRWAAIDVGTNSVLLLVAEVHQQRLSRIEEAFQTTRLGEGFPAQKLLTPQAVKRTIAVIQQYLKKAQQLGAQQVIIFATQVLRHAQNAHSFVEQVKKETGLEVTILNEAQEALLSFYGALDSLPEVDQPVWVFDVGGGSTEVVYGHASSILYHRSFPVGGVQLRHTFHLSDQISPSEIVEIRNFLADVFDLPAVEDIHPFILGIGGTVTTLASVDMRLVEYDFQSVDGHQLSLKRIQELMEQMNSLPLKERQKLPGMEPGRADIIVPATLIVLHLLQRLKKKFLMVSARGLRYGVVKWKAGLVNLPEI